MGKPALQLHIAIVTVPQHRQPTRGPLNCTNIFALTTLFPAHKLINELCNFVLVMVHRSCM